MYYVLRRQLAIKEHDIPYSFSPYLGCTYGCIYCYSTCSEHWIDIWKKSWVNPSVAKPKNNIVKRLEKNLLILKDILDIDKEMKIGNIFDPYPLIEPKHKVTRRCLELFEYHPDWTVHNGTKLGQYNVSDALPIENFGVLKTIETNRLISGLSILLVGLTLFFPGLNGIISLIPDNNKELSDNRKNEKTR